MRTVDTVVIGGGQAGLAMSRALTERGVEHVVLERGRVGERWRSERWESLRLLTPRWLSRVGGWSPDDDIGDPEGFMDRLEVIRYLERFAGAADVPLMEGVTVTSVERDETGYRVDTSAGAFRAQAVVVATGECQSAFVPSMARELAGWVHQVTPTDYKTPDQLPDGGVLVVGASATGIQLAQEIHASGRPVTLSVGRHTRLPRRYRGRDILEWLHRVGVLDQQVHEVGSPSASRDQPSMQLTGSQDHRSLDLRILQEEGVRLVGRAEGASGTKVSLADDLVETMAAADVKLAGVRLRIDRYVSQEGLEGQTPPPDPFLPVPLGEGPPSLELRSVGIRTVLWATGFRRSYPWLRVPVLDAGGEIRHRGGVTPAQGLYVLGLNFLRRRSSSFLGGVARDAEVLADHLIRTRSRRRGAGRAVA